jgi:hypothetical protein
VTLFGIFLTPVFYYVIQWFSDRRMQARRAAGLMPDEHSGNDAGEDGRHESGRRNGHAVPESGAVEPRFQEPTTASH